MTVSVIGKGNVGTHLAQAVRSVCSCDDSVCLVDSRTLSGLPEYSDVILIAVKDDAVAEVAERVALRGGIVAHTSGSVPMSAVASSANSYGVFYPLQTFTKDVAMDYGEIPFFIEASDSAAFKALQDFALRISSSVFPADSDTRQSLHIAAVLACNFANHMVSLADRFLKENGLDYKVLMPLIHRTVDKLDAIPPREAQTGPAVRGDRSVMESHLKRLAPDSDLADIYRSLSESIAKYNLKVNL